MRTPWFPEGFDVDARRVRTGVHVDAILTALAERQHGVVTALQLLALGVTRAQIRERLRSGHLMSVSAGVYLVGHTTATAEGRRMVGVLAAGDDALLADLNAAVHLGADVLEPRQLHVLIPPGRRVEREGITARAVVVLPRERTIVDGIPCLTWPRVLLDVAAHRGRATLERLWHDAVYRKALDERGIRQVLDDHFGEPGTVELRRLWERRQHALGVSANRLEDALRDIVVEAGMPEPRRNERLRIDGVTLRPDLYIPERRLAFETDGRDGHEDPEQQLSDDERDALYASAGLVVGRFGWWAVNYQRPGVLQDFVRFEAAWQRCGGTWTTAASPPAFEFARRRAPLSQAA
jgi:very-short-patch-repair endonuclease